MTEQNELSRDRIEVALDRGTRIVRLLTWTAMFVLVCLMLWVVSGMAARAEDPRCQSALKIDPLSACKTDPPERHGGGCPGSQ